MGSATPLETRFDRLSMGYQTVAPGGRVREHSHGVQVELQACFRGRGWVVVDGQSHPLVPGTACFLGQDVEHEIVNEGDEDTIGLRRRPGEPAPTAFDRPSDVVAVERALGMNDTRA